MNSKQTLMGLIRHGETGQTGFRGSLDDELTEQGLKNMFLTLNNQNQTQWKSIVSSPLIRCAKFAQQYAQTQHIPCRFDQRLCELNFGAWEGMDSIQLMATQEQALTRFWADPYSYTPPDAEPLQAFEKRVLSVWQSIIQNSTGQRILVVTHGGVIRVILRHVRALPANELLNIEVPHAALFQVMIENNISQDKCKTKIF